MTEKSKIFFGCQAFKLKNPPMHRYTEHCIFMQKRSFQSTSILFPNGLVEAKHVGTAMVTAKGKYVDATFEIKVDPLYNTYKEPLPLYGFSKSAVVIQENRTLISDNDKHVSYTGYTGDFASTYILQYRLDENEKVKDCIIAIGKNYEEEVHKFLTERYYKLESVYFNEELIIGTGDLDEDFMYVLYQKIE